METDTKKLTKEQLLKLADIIFDKEKLKEIVREAIVTAGLEKKKSILLGLNEIK